MTHDELVKVLTAEYPGSSWSYTGDGSSLDGLAWHDTETEAPVLADLEAALAGVQLAAAVQAKQAELTAALAATDWWDARAYAEGAKVSPARLDYRTNLRSLYQQAAAATDVATVEAIVIPDAPAYTP